MSSPIGKVILTLEECFIALNSNIALGILHGMELKGPSGQNIFFRSYENDDDVELCHQLMVYNLSEPYSIYTYRFFLHNWPELCVLAFDTETGECIGAIIGRIHSERDPVKEGYIAMLAVNPAFRGRGIGSRLVRMLLDACESLGCVGVHLETEVSNVQAQRLYERFGFIKSRCFARYYLNGSNAYRLQLLFSPKAPMMPIPQIVLGVDDEEIMPAKEKQQESHEPLVEVDGFETTDQSREQSDTGSEKQKLSKNQKKRLRKKNKKAIQQQMAEEEED